MTDKKRDVKSLIEKESPNLNNLLDPKEVQEFKELTEELRDTWTKKQIFRTETEMRFSVLNDLKHPTNASKYWQCIREQDTYLENLMHLSFDYRKQAARVKWLSKRIETEEDEYKKECFEIDLDRAKFDLAKMELTAKDRMREIKLWSNLKKEFDDGSFDTQNVNQHQLESYHKIMINRKDALGTHASQPEIVNVLGQLKTIEKLKKEKLLSNKKTYFLDNDKKDG